MTIWITSGDRPSNGRLALQKAGGFRKLDPSKLKTGDRVINWGCSNPDIIYITTYLNYPNIVKLAADKLKAFIKFQYEGVQTVEWSNVRQDAINWLADGKIVVVRNKLTGHSGEGIVIIDPKTPNAEVPQAPLYTKYVQKVKEFRVHVVGTAVIDTQQKIRDPDREPTDWKVRSHENGFIFARNNVQTSDARNVLAVSAIVALGLDFGAVDIIEDKQGKLYVLEVNTAPGLEGQTIQSYVTAFKGLCANGN